MSDSNPSFDDAADKRLPKDQDYYLKQQIDAFGDFLQNVAYQLADDPGADAIHFVFPRFEKTEKNLIFSYPKHRDDLLQTLHYYTNEMLANLKNIYADSITKSVQPAYAQQAHQAAAGLYIQWMDCYRNRKYDSEKIQEMIGLYADSLLDHAPDLDNFCMGTSVLEQTFLMQYDLLEKKEIDRKQTALFIYYTAADYIKALPHATDDGLEQDQYDARLEKNHISYVVHHVYSHAMKAVHLHNAALELMLQIRPNKGVSQLLQKMQPDFSLSLVGKNLEKHIVRKEDGIMHHVSDASFMQQGVWATADYSLTTLRESNTPPQDVKAIVYESYLIMANTFINKSETALLMGLYDKASNTLPDENSRTAFRRHYAPLHMDAMIKKKNLTEAGIFFNHIDQEIPRSPVHILALLNENKDTIIGISASLKDKGKYRNKATILFSESTPQKVTHIVFEERQKRKDEKDYITYDPDEKIEGIKGVFINQINDIAYKVMQNGLSAEYTELSPRLRLIKL